jgi:hypothetical protein
MGFTKEIKCGRRVVVVEYPTGKQYTKSLLSNEELNKRISSKYIGTYKIISDKICDGNLIWENDSEYDYESWNLRIIKQCTKCRHIYSNICGPEDITDLLNDLKV